MRRRAPRFKAYRQLERFDCGITCVRMIARYFGKNIPLKELRKLAETNRQGISLQDINDELARRHVIDHKVKQEKMTGDNQ